MTQKKLKRERETVLTADCSKVETTGKVGKAGYHIGKKCTVYIESWPHGFSGKKGRSKRFGGIDTVKMILGEP